MQGFSSFRSHLLSLESDSEISQAFKEFFSKFGPISSVDRFFGIGNWDARYYLIQFKEFTDANMVTNRYNLRSFGFNGVMIELGSFIKDPISDLTQI